MSQKGATKALCHWRSSLPAKKRKNVSLNDDRIDDMNAGSVGQVFGQSFDGASARAVRIGRVIDRLCRAPGTYQITIAVPVQRRAPWQVTYYRMEPMRKELSSK